MSRSVSSDLKMLQKTNKQMNARIHYFGGYKCLGKVMAQCFDWAAFMSCGLNGVESKVNYLYLNMPMYKYGYVYLNIHVHVYQLTQGSLKPKECKIFLSSSVS